MCDGCDGDRDECDGDRDEVDGMKRQLESIDAILNEYTDAAIGNPHLAMLIVRIRVVRMEAD